MLSVSGFFSSVAILLSSCRATPLMLCCDPQRLKAKWKMLANARTLRLSARISAQNQLLCCSGLSLKLEKRRKNVDLGRRTVRRELARQLWVPNGMCVYVCEAWFLLHMREFTTVRRAKRHKPKIESVYLAFTLKNRIFSAILFICWLF